MSTEDAKNEVVRLCTPGESWRMSIPANPQRDSDLILMDALNRLSAFEALVDEWEADQGIFSPDSRYTRDVMVREARRALAEVSS